MALKIEEDLLVIYYEHFSFSVLMVFLCPFSVHSLGYQLLAPDYIVQVNNLYRFSKR